ncbi:hypothetical protein B0H11DRAFT_1918820 [Mycena galericulata]|nr:hypothetical protein B0H11DRAFT_1918820 [Mycena galericulata]
MFQEQAADNFTLYPPKVTQIFVQRTGRDEMDIPYTELRWSPCSRVYILPGAKKNIRWEPLEIIGDPVRERATVIQWFPVDITGQGYPVGAIGNHWQPSEGRATVIQWFPVDIAGQGYLHQ